ncbi:beta-ketoacyl-[acyl-carrier-protein] synthase II [Chitinophaga alhagiae]|uniref:3-oxoacyl-[acyl-carrier-protein] synthase 2 n=1 Tax=Chitinophaga alhagiae TaxID=2203219 RepID=A0ABM6WD44_9BACT|nr:beta-ketoacyl-ACP synthase II [Chitinophaga alhagiae]AWO01822.1 beta-ketoacyl-[acyl-carrier-protein] synthase II [Chitinophaga alhagiae]
MQPRRVVVTGLGALTPLGNSVDAYWQGLASGVSGADYIKQFDASKFKTRFACELKDFDPAQYMDKKDARKMDPFTQTAVIAADQAVADAKVDRNSINVDRVGVIWGTGVGGMINFTNELKEFHSGDGTPRFSPFLITRLILDIAAGHISMRHGFRGPNFSVVSACASATNAIIEAMYTIRYGKADMIITGGSENIINEPCVGGFNAMKALSERNEDPKTASRPFDLDRDGFVMGEGAGALVLESYEHAIARGAKIYVELAGGGATADAHHITAPHPEGLGARSVMTQALNDAGLRPEDIDYINVHGTSTPLGDIAEVKAIQQVFGEAAYKLNISSTKSMTGHLLGAAGAVESIAVIKSILESLVPPTINHFTDDPQLDAGLNYTFNVAQKREVRAGLSNTFGFGGHNASVVFKKFVP